MGSLIAQLGPQFGQRVGEGGRRLKRDKAKNLLAFRQRRLLQAPRSGALYGRGQSLESKAGGF